jgi:hypothetical protein
MSAIRFEGSFARISSTAVEARRVFISRYFWENLDGKCRYGLLRGFKLDDDPSWGAGDLAPKLFGLYEQEVLQLLTDLRGRHRFLVNLGAGDGYYGVGLVAAGVFERSICFEATEKGRAAIKRTAQQNGVAEKIKILGAAGAEFTTEFAGSGIEASDCLILCDVEGTEFHIFSEECLASLRGAHIVIELHGYLLPNGDELERKLISNGQRDFRTSIVRTSMRDLSLIPELETLSDSDRWLICSEGRPRLMSWLTLSPK